MEDGLEKQDLLILLWTLVSSFTLYKLTYLFELIFKATIPVVKITILIDSNLIKMVSILDKNLCFAIDGLYSFCLKEEVGT